MQDHDYSPASDFLTRFFGPTTTHQVEIRALPNESGAGPARPLFTRDSSLILAHCRRWDAVERAVYFGVATRQSGIARGDRTNLVELPALWVDIDLYKLGINIDEAVTALAALPIPPGIVVASGGGVHAYWLLIEAIDISQDDPARWPTVERDVVSALKGLAGILCGDLSVCDLARIMRLPGTHNTKDGTLRPCVVLDCSTWARVEFGDLVEMLDTQRPLLTNKRQIPDPLTRPDDNNPFLAAAQLLSFKPAIDVEARLAAMAYLGAGASAIHATQLSVSASLVSLGAEDDDIVALVLAATVRAAGVQAAAWNWQREEAALRRMIASARAKFVPMPRSATVHQLRAGGAKAAPLDEPEPDTAPAPGSFARNDLGNAHTLIARHGSDLRYVLGIGWHKWDGKRYALDPESVATRRLVYDVSNALLLEAAALPASKARSAAVKWAVASGNSGRISGCLDAARSFLFSQADDLDADPWLLNCQNGTLDLRSLELRPHSQADLLSSIVACDYDPAALCPMWEAFLLSIFDDDADMVSFVQRGLGYSLTGSTKEQVVFILHGNGSNGKSVLLETIASILRDYIKSAPSETFSSKDRSGIPNDVAMLATARFISVVETEHGRHLAEGLVKQATGSDRMTARFLHREWFEFTPRFKIWMATNHKPLIRGSDYAIWRRIRLLPFLVRFVDSNPEPGQRVKDPDLKDKLTGELPGILAWMVRGCLAWQREGLHAPVAVEEATKGYREGQDNISLFVEERCHLSRGLRCEIGLLHEAYGLWCAEYDEEAVSKRAFGSNLEERGHSPESGTGRVRLRRGIDLKEEYRLEAQLSMSAKKAGNSATRATREPGEEG